MHTEKFEHQKVQFGQLKKLLTKCRDYIFKFLEQHSVVETIKKHNNSPYAAIRALF